MTHTEPEHWIHLEREKELEDYKAWTVRISWPASVSEARVPTASAPWTVLWNWRSRTDCKHPTKFNLKAYSQSPNSILLHVNASALSPRFRHPHGLSSSPADPHHSYGQISTHVNANFFTPIHLVFEPLYLGFLPRTALLAVFWVSIFAVGAAILLPWIHRTVEGILEWSGEEWRYESDGKRENTGLSSEGEGARSFGSGTGVRQRGENRKEAKAHAG